MRHRERVIRSGRALPDGLGIEREVDDDEVGGKPPYPYRRRSHAKYEISSDSGQSYSYHWYDPWSNKWFGPVQVSSSPSSVSGPNGFYTYLGTSTQPDAINIPSGFIWKAIENYGKSDVNIGVFLGELRETVQMFHKPWQVAAALATHGPKIPKWVKSVPDAVAWASSTYLGYRYGVRPFLSDVRGFCKLSERLNQRMRSRVSEKPLVLKVFRNQTRVSSYQGENANKMMGPAYHVAWANTQTFTVKKCEWCLVTPNPSAQSMGVARTFANTFHLDDIAGIAWELTPYSFIVDWFLPVGDMIQSSLGAPGVLVSASEPWGHTKTMREIHNSSSGLSSSSWRSDIRFDHTYKVESFSRYPLGSFPPKPVDINGWQKLDLALIAGQTLSGIFGKSFRR